MASGSRNAGGESGAVNWQTETSGSNEEWADQAVTNANSRSNDIHVVHSFVIYVTSDRPYGQTDMMEVVLLLPRSCDVPSEISG
jgi:hypothetical protein